MQKPKGLAGESGQLFDGQAAFLEAQKQRLETLSRAQCELLRQFETMNREVMEGWQESAEQVREIAAQAASNPAEATRLYFDLMTRQMERMIDQGRRFSERWMSIVQTSASEMSEAGGATAGEGAQRRPKGPQAANG
ncbi:MAG: phasin family protein [Alphaproteobacteria bacterium]|nr:phasin family protein [Alphaproteobacteria bacterium]